MDKHKPEPFGFFRAEPFGWTDCAETDKGAQPLFDQAAIDFVTGQRDQLLEACKAAQECGHQLDSWALEIINSAVADVERPAAAPDASADGWIEWKGGELPAIDRRAFVEVRFRSGRDASGDPDYAYIWYWQHDGDDSDIIAYRVVQGGAS